MSSQDLLPVWQTLASNVLEGARANKAGANKAGFEDLANEAYQVVCAVSKEKQEGKELPPDLTHDLLNQLKDVENFVLKRRNFFMRIVMANADKRRILKYRQMLTHTLSNLRVQLKSDVKHSLAQIAKRQKEIDMLLQRRNDLHGGHGINAANSTFTSIPDHVNESAVHSTIANTNSGNVSAINYTCYSGGWTPRSGITPTELPVYNICR